VDKDGKMPDAYSLDEPQVDILVAKKVPPPMEDKKSTSLPGGPSARIPNARIKR
jgi:hypothetical protein